MSASASASATSGTPSSEEMLDILIVGGGPGGTATAFRARELGMKALIVDYDDLMKRIRDYSKDKLILPDFGGGDLMKFPKGGPLIQSLYFAAIDKDDMCTKWKALHKKHGIPSAIGLELTGLQAMQGGYEVRCWNHQTRSPAAYRAKYVVIAIGHGVPRRFDIPGNTEGVAFRLTDPARYVGKPACVVGGGTSAAEAVIAISGSKAEAGDKSPVYWSYRGDRLPRVSKALAEAFFEAYAGNGNIRYYPLSEPAAVVIAEDHQEYLSLRVDRRRMEGRPSETLHLEFPKTSCIACIGEDIPETLLREIGVELVKGGPRNKKRMVVNRLLESQRPNVFLVGDILSQAYFETEDFNADPATFKEIKHRGNIKSALRDGVYVAEVIKQKLEGRKEIDVVIGDAEGPPPSEGAKAPSGQYPVVASTQQPAARKSAPAGPCLIRVLPGGVAENEYPLNERGTTTIGRSNCDLSFPDDSQMAERHAGVIKKDANYYLKDGGSPTGTFLRIEPAEKRKLVDGDLVRMGRQFLLFNESQGRATVTHYDHLGKEKGKHPVTEKPTVLGREADITLDPDDMTLSRRHLAISIQDGALTAKDLKSANGSFLRVQNFVKIGHGSQFQTGQQQFIFSLDRDAVMDLGAPEPPAPKAATPPPDTRDASDAAVSVTFSGTGKTCPAKEGQTICEVAEANGISIRAECHAGICGSDPVRIVSGKENLFDAPDDQESETLEDLCDLKPGPNRLACKARIKGKVTVEILEV